jgi:ferredoxin
MEIDSARLIYFSPTRTTRKVIEGIAQGVCVDKVECVDLTPPDAASRKVTGVNDDLAIIGAPVYAGRLPSDAVSRLLRLEGNGTPAVIVVVYGNRAYEDALLELRDLAVEAGFRPVAAGAFVGEHSYSGDATPIAVGRPDGEDLRQAKEFGQMIREKVRNLRAPDEIPELRVPGNFPYKERAGLSNITPAMNAAACAECGKCVSVCPTAAISMGEAVVTDPSACIRCCACVKICTAGARTMADPRIRQVAELLSINCRERKEPETWYF